MKSRPGQSQAFSLFSTCPFPTLPCRNPYPNIWGCYSLGAIISASLGEGRGGTHYVPGILWMLPKPHNSMSLEFVTHLSGENTKLKFREVK